MNTKWTSPAAYVIAACMAAACAAPKVVPSGAPAAAVSTRAQTLGTYSWPITTSSRQAQAHFDEGLRLMYGYATAEAEEAFGKARRADSACAMCWWGEAWSMGPSFNSAMAAQKAPLAFAAAARARSLAATTTPVEQAVIEALVPRYAPTHPAAGRKPLDSAFVNAMAGVHARFPRHDDAATLYADALMLIEPRRGIWPLEKPAVARIHEVLEQVLARDIAHPGACHAYIHATETTPKAGNAQRCADLLGAAIPGVSHVNHMPSHTYNRVGRWGDATQSNLVAVETDRRATRGQAYAIYPTHNLHMLFFSASVDGQERVAIQAANDYAAMVPGDGAGFQAMVLARFGRFDDIFPLTKAPAHPIHQGMWAFGRGLAHLRRGSRDSAAVWLARVDSLAEHTPKTRVFRVHEPARLIGVVGNILRGEILRAAGRTDEAIAALRAAAPLDAAIHYDEPEPLPFMSSDFLGAALLDAGRAAEAVTVYEAALVARPANGWSLFGLERALRASGRVADADAARARFEKAWARSTVKLSASR
jgi:tetratricopeptide (TPR) repeat protein